MRTWFRLVAGVMLALATAAGALAGNGNSPQAFRVLDKHNKLVGYSLSDNLVARQINGVWVTFYTQSASGIFDSRAIYVYYLTTDCSGPRYVTHYSNFSEGTRVGPTLYFATDAQILTPRSTRVISGDGEEGLCGQTLEVAGSYGVAASIEVDSLALEPPFKATQ